MVDNIRTRWHDWQSAMRVGNVLVDQDDGKLCIGHRHSALTLAKLSSFTQDMEGVPHYFLSESCLPVVKSQACTDSIIALHRAGLTRLPHPHCLVEFSDTSGRPRRDKTRYFILVSERKSPMGVGEHVYHQFECQAFMLLEPDYNVGKFAELREQSMSPKMRPLWSGSGLPKTWAVAGQLSVMIAVVEPGFVSVGGNVMKPGEYHIGSIAAPWSDHSKLNPKIRTDAVMEFINASILALRSLLMLMRTRGIDKEVISPARLNKARVGRGQVRVPDHTVVYIGSYVNSEGKRVKYDPTKPGHRFQKIHMRSAHTKRVWTGPKSLPQVPEERYIEAYLVNYTEGDEIPKPRPKIVRQARQRQQEAQQ